MTQALSPDGDWQVIFDDDNKGRPLHWEQAESFLSHPEPETVSVPACLEEFRQNYEGVAWCAGLKHKQNYLGVSGTHRGADLALLPHGKGKFVLSTRRPTVNLGQDPVADRILDNLVHWLG